MIYRAIWRMYHWLEVQIVWSDNSVVTRCEGRSNTDPHDHWWNDIQTLKRQAKYMALVSSSSNSSYNAAVIHRGGSNMCAHPNQERIVHLAPSTTNFAIRIINSTKIRRSCLTFVAMQRPHQCVVWVPEHPRDIVRQKDLGIHSTLTTSKLYEWCRDVTSHVSLSHCRRRNHKI